MGSDRHYPEEAPVHSVTIDPFWIDRTPVTNREFRKFVQATGYITFAEMKPDARDYPGALPHMLRAGSLVFTPPKNGVDLRDWSQWWTFKFGANWHRPYGPRSSIAGLDNHPVVHIAYRDAEAYAQWAGKKLPTEAEWEFAARGGRDGTEFAWGDEFTGHVRQEGVFSRLVKVAINAATPSGTLQSVRRRAAIDGMADCAAPQRRYQALRLRRTAARLRGLTAALRPSAWHPCLRRRRRSLEAGHAADGI